LFRDDVEIAPCVLDVRFRMFRGGVIAGEKDVGAEDGVVGWFGVGVAVEDFGVQGVEAGAGDGEDGRFVGEEDGSLGYGD